MKIFLTGAAGFIGSHLARSLCESGHEVFGIDNLNPYYDVTLKHARLENLKKFPNFKFQKLDLVDRETLHKEMKNFGAKVIAHLAAQAGVRYSVENPYAYVDSNLTGFVNMIEGAVATRIEHFVYASTSSVYGANEQMPFSPHDGADHPLSLYSATKRANELMAHSYSAMHGLPCTGLRFFTVYGPWGRPDMALFLFTKNILEGKPIKIFNHGKHSRDFTYVDDIVQGLCKVIEGKPAEASPKWDPKKPDPALSRAPYKIYNIGNSERVPLMRYVEFLEKALGTTAEKEYLPLQKGDVPETWADIKDLTEDFGYKPTTSVEVGVNRFVDWYKSYYSGGRVSNYS